MQNHEIVSWIRKAFNAEHYIDFRVELDDKKNAATEGYTSNMVFAKITLAGEDKKLKEIYVAIKFIKKALLQVSLVKEAYKKEICFYEKLILDVFADIQKESKVEEPFEGVPKFYTSLANNKMEMLVLENLSKSDYKLHRRDLPMDIEHFKIAYKNFAKFHALSFALKYKNEDLFHQVSTHFSVTNNLLDEFAQFLDIKALAVIDILRQSQRDDLAEKLEKLVAPGVSNLIKNLLYENVDKTVIAHFDCHCNNFMFKYSETDESFPTNIAILDWQMARVHSPAIDLGYFFYSVGSKIEFSQQKYLLNYYYQELSNFLKQLGCDAEDLFPFSTFLDHWKKYSLYGFIYACWYMDFCYFDNDNAPKLDEVDDVNGMVDAISKNIALKNPELYRERLVATVECYFENN